MINLPLIDFNNAYQKFMTSCDNLKKLPADHINKAHLAALRVLFNHLEVAHENVKTHGSEKDKNSCLKPIDRCTNELKEIEQFFYATFPHLAPEAGQQVDQAPAAEVQAPVLPPAPELQNAEYAHEAVRRNFENIEMGNDADDLFNKLQPEIMALRNKFQRAEIGARIQRQINLYNGKGVLEFALIHPRNPEGKLSLILYIPPSYPELAPGERIECGIAVTGPAAKAMQKTIKEVLQQKILEFNAPMSITSLVHTWYDVIRGLLQRALEIAQKMQAERAEQAAQAVQANQAADAAPAAVLPPPPAKQNKPTNR